MKEINFIKISAKLLKKQRVKWQYRDYLSQTCPIILNQMIVWDDLTCALLPHDSLMTRFYTDIIDIKKITLMSGEHWYKTLAICLTD